MSILARIANLTEWRVHVNLFNLLIRDLVIIEYEPIQFMCMFECFHAHI